MIQAASHSERERLEALQACAVLDTPRESAFDNIVFTAAQIFRVPMAAICLIDDHRVWVKSGVGPLPTHWTRGQTFGDLILEMDQLIVIEDTATDPRCNRTPDIFGHTPIRFCAGAPLHGPGEHVIGALCVMDRHPKAIPDRARYQLLQLARETQELLRLRVPDFDLTL